MGWERWREGAKNKNLGLGLRFVWVKGKIKNKSIENVEWEREHNSPLNKKAMDVCWFIKFTSKYLKWSDEWWWLVVIECMMQNVSSIHCMSYPPLKHMEEK